MSQAAQKETDTIFGSGRSSKTNLGDKPFNQTEPSTLFTGGTYYRDGFLCRDIILSFLCGVALNLSLREFKATPPETSTAAHWISDC